MNRNKHLLLVNAWNEMKHQRSVEANQHFLPVKVANEMKPAGISEPVFP